MALSSNYALIPEAWQAKPENIDAIVAFRDFLHAHGFLQAFTINKGHRRYQFNFNHTVGTQHRKDV